MRQDVIIVKELSNGHVLASIKRPSACGGECGSCKGCAALEQHVTVEAVNRAGVKTGDRAVVESSTKRILWLAVLAYLMPLVLFFLLYAVSPVMGVLGFAAGMGALVPLNRLVAKQRLYTVVELTKRGE